MAWYGNSWGHHLARKGFTFKNFIFQNPPKTKRHKYKINNWKITEMSKLPFGDKLFYAHKDKKEIYIRRDMDYYKLYATDKNNIEKLLFVSKDYNDTKKQAYKIIKRI